MHKPRSISVSKLQLSLSKALNQSCNQKRPLLITKSGTASHLIIPYTLVHGGDLSSLDAEQLLKAVSASSRSRQDSV